MFLWLLVDVITTIGISLLLFLRSIKIRFRECYYQLDMICHPFRPLRWNILKTPKRYLTTTTSESQLNNYLVGWKHQINSSCTSTFNSIILTCYFLNNQNYLEKTETCTATLLTPNTSEIYPNTNPKVMGIHWFIPWKNLSKVLKLKTHRTDQANKKKQALKHPLGDKFSL